MAIEVMWNDQDTAAGISGTPLNQQSLSRMLPSFMADGRMIRPAGAARRGFVLTAGAWARMGSGPDAVILGTDDDIINNYAEQLLDSGVSFQAGRDYYIYMVRSAAGGALKVSLNATMPAGFTAANSRKIGGFHTLCAAVGAIPGHPLSGFNAGDILPASVWCLKHRPSCAPEGMVWIEPLDFWADIYLQSGTGANAKSVYGGTIAGPQSCTPFILDLAAAGKSALSDEEFLCAAAGSNQKTIISGGARPAAAGGHSDTAGRRMISSYGLEDCCGALWQWLRNSFYNGQMSASWQNDATGWGQILQTASMKAGGCWTTAAICGAAARDSTRSRFENDSKNGGRGRAGSL